MIAGAAFHRRSEQLADRTSRPAPPAPTVGGMTNHVLLALSVAACGATSAPRPSYRAEPYELERLNGERIAAELGVFEVSEDRERPASRRIKLRFVRLPATTPRPGAPIIYLRAGPEGPGSTRRGVRGPPCSWPFARSPT